jgi:hypothetical protein
VDVTGGTTPYTYLWSNSATSEDISGLAEGNYTLTATDATGCSMTIDATVNNNTGSFAISNVVVQNANCLSPSGFIDLTMTGGTPTYTFNWSNSATTEDIAGLAAGNYSCVITDNAGCIINYSTTITNGSGSITTSSVVQDAMCGNDNGSIEVTVTGGISPFTYTWNGATPSTCCDYSLELEDLFGDGWNGGSLEIFINGTSAGNYAAAGNGNTETIAVCDGDIIELDYSAGAWEEENIYTLFDAQGNSLFTDGPNPAIGLVYTTTAACSSTAPNMTGIYNLGAGTYDLTVTDDVGCTYTESYDVVAVASDLQLNITSITDDNCLQGDGQVVYTVSGGSAPYDVTLNGVPDGGTPGQFSNENAGTYDLVVWDAYGCTDTLVVVIGNTTTFTTTVVSVVDETCNQGNGSIDLTISGGTPFFNWSNGETTEDISNLTAGTYTIDITSFGPFCQDQQTFTINNITDFTLSENVTNEFCGGADGSIDLTITGGTNMSYSWSNGATTEDLSGLSAGTYTCTVTNLDSGCETFVSYDIINVTTGVAVNGFATDDFCGEGSGAVDIDVTGGSGSYSFDWSNGATTEDITGVTQGNYSVTVTDLNDGCEVILDFTVGNNTSFFVIENITDAPCATCPNGSIDLTMFAFPADDPYTFSWSNGATTEDISGLLPGTYTVTITSGSGCTTTIDYVVGNSNSVGAEENEVTVHLSVYPNPARDQFVIDYRFASDNAVKLIMTNTLGELVFESVMPETTGHESINIEHLARGIYFVTITDGIHTETIRLMVARK